MLSGGISLKCYSKTAHSMFMTEPVCSWALMRYTAVFAEFIWPAAVFGLYCIWENCVNLTIGDIRLQ